MYYNDAEIGTWVPSLFWTHLLTDEEIVELRQIQGDYNTDKGVEDDDDDDEQSTDSSSSQHVIYPELSRALCYIDESVIEALPEHAITNDREEIMESRVISLLGLQDNASESEVYQAVKDLKNRLANAEERLLEIEANEFVDANRERISNADTFKELYKRHGKEVAEAFLGAVK